MSFNNSINTELQKILLENKNRWIDFLKKDNFSSILEECKEICFKFLYKNEILPHYDCFEDVKPYNNIVAETYNMNYINASYLNKFIACQEPKTEYISLFYEFLIKSKAELIIALKNDLTYFRKDENHKKTVIVKNDLLTIEEIYLDQEENHKITRITCIAWKDFGILSSEQMEMLYTEVLKYDAFKNQHKTIVHCWAGVGRTGTFILFTILKERSLKERITHEILIEEFIKLRCERCLTVQSSAQLKFLVDYFIKSNV
ncbi:Ptpn3 [Ecytonucleospora hepatopenaei]|uniref:Ptpn3 n=1 Tax=Ecytonucleospora hepatopenaei TaxID=646526 RepID=A0A1W0E6P7_9MICR|nr:Ptpn3 [Ecytonucleospora hepatopenaei]